MLDVLRENWPYLLIPAVATFVGGAASAARPVSARVRSLAQHLAAGAVFAAVAVELLPEVVAAHRPVATAVGFALGTALMLAIRWKTESVATVEGAPSSGTGLIAAVGVDLAIDGLLIGIGFTAGQSEGILLTIALTLEVAFLSLATAATLLQNGLPPRRAVQTVGWLALVLLAAAVAGATLFSGLSDAPLEATLAFGVSALLYLVTEELLVEAHETAETPVTTGMFFFGFLVVLIVEMSR